MSKVRKQYDREFKIMAVELSNSRDNMGLLAKELDIRPELLYRWRREISEHPETSFSGNGKVLYTPEQAELHRLKKELEETRIERDILKKAVGIFSRSDHKYSGL
jgi:transposase